MTDLLIKSFLDIGEAMLECGSEVYRAEDTVRRMCVAYGAVHCDVYALPNLIQVSVETPEGRVITQLRYVRGSTKDYDLLDRLNALARKICDEKPEREEVKRRIQETLKTKPRPLWSRILACAFIMGGFTVFFGGTYLDGAVAAVIGVIVALLDVVLSRYESNEFVYTFVVSFVIGVGAFLPARFFPSLHPGMIVIGSIMLLISALGFTNGVRCVFRRNFLSGTLKMVSALVGAGAIAGGVALAMLMFVGTRSYVVSLNTSAWEQLIFTTIGCLGLAIWQNIRGAKKLFFAALGAFLAWGVVLLLELFGMGSFAATLLASVFVGFYGVAMAKVNHSPATIFLTACMFALIPGANLYGIMNGILSGDRSFAVHNLEVCITTALAIALGFIVVNVVMRYARILSAAVRGKEIPDPKEGTWL